MVLTQTGGTRKVGEDESQTGARCSENGREPRQVVLTQTDGTLKVCEDKNQTGAWCSENGRRARQVVLTQTGGTLKVGEGLGRYMAQRKPKKI